MIYHAYSSTVRLRGNSILMMGFPGFVVVVVVIVVYIDYHINFFVFDIFCYDPN